jgi:hypothetical protein
MEELEDIGFLSLVESNRRNSGWTDQGNDVLRFSSRMEHNCVRRVINHTRRVMLKDCLEVPLIGENEDPLVAEPCDVSAKRKLRQQQTVSLTDSMPVSLTLCIEMYLFPDRRESQTDSGRTCHFVDVGLACCGYEGFPSPLARFMALRRKWIFLYLGESIC